jgi:hypothetical protein
MPPGPSAADATIADALQLLDGPFASMADQVAQDCYALWLGSGISLGRVEGLDKLIVRVLVFLQQRVTAGDANCPFRAALDNVFVAASLSAADRTAIVPLALKRTIISFGRALKSPRLTATPP